jgi:hypothetical protein
MTKRSIILLLVVCFSITAFTVQVLSQQRNPNLTAKQPDAKRSSLSGLDREQRQKEFQESVAKLKEEFLREKYALRVTEEQWKLIKAKLEKVRQLRDQATSTVGVFLISSSGSGTSSVGRASRSVPTWQWKQPWKDKAPGEMTEAQKLAKQLIALVEKQYTSTEQFRRTMDALRKARRKEAEIIRQLSEAQQELREMLTTRQEAALVLMNWL